MSRVILAEGGIISVCYGYVIVTNFKDRVASIRKVLKPRFIFSLYSTFSVRIEIRNRVCIIKMTPHAQFNMSDLQKVKF